MGKIKNVDGGGSLGMSAKEFGMIQGPNRRRRRRRKRRRRLPRHEKHQEFFHHSVGSRK
jgi:hypothetical protein